MQLSTLLTQMVIADSRGEARGGLNEKRRIFNRGAEDRQLGGGAK